VNFGNTGVGTSAYIDNRILSELFGVKVNMVKGYPGSADKRIAIERGELDGDCGSWTSMPEEWLRDSKITVHIRFSRRLVTGMPEQAASARDLLTDPKNREIFGLLTASAVIGRPYIAPKAVPADRLAALRAAFDATMKEPEFLADSERQRLLVTPMTGSEVETYIRELHRTSPDVVAAAKAISGE
jgi:tripartite-type tricarboxylate transporter receptor subunit TctC